MDDLVQWLRAQLDEDERIARAAEGDPVFDGTGIVIERNRARGFPDRSAGLISPVAAHIAEWDPARVLREIDAQRRIIELHALEYRERPERAIGEADDPFCAECFGEGYPCETLRLLALPFADRPGYKDDWRP